MPQVMDTSSQIQHEDEDTTKKTSGVLETFRNGIRPVAQKSPLTPGSRGSKNQSPSTPSKAPHSPGVTSPLRSVAVLFHTEDHDDESQKGRPVMRSRTEPNVARLDSLLKKGASIRRSLRFGSKKDKPQDAFLAVRDEAEEEGEEGEAWEEMEETYTLPELPRIPLSVMQINKLIEMEVLEEAHLHLLALRAEFQRERLRLAQEDSPVELAKKEKDLSLLYADLRLKMASIVRTSVSLPARNEGLLVHVARIVQEEDKRAREPGGLQGSWMDAWREAVDRGARDKVEGVHLEPSNDGNASWLAVHLGLLGKALLEDLEKAKNELRRSYPPSFRVFATYVRAYHAAVGRHLRTLEGRATRLKDLYALLDWTVRRYRGERIMGSAALEPDMSAADADLRVDDDFLRRLRTKFCDTVKEDLRASLDRLLELENEEMWSVGKRPDTDADRLFTSVFHVDICTVRHRRATLGRRRLRRQTLARVCVCVCWRACVRTESERERGQRRARRRRAGTRRDRFVPGRAEGFPQEVRRRVPPPPPLVRASRRSAVERVPRRLRQLLQRLTRPHRGVVPALQPARGGGARRGGVAARARPPRRPARAIRGGRQAVPAADDDEEVADERRRLRSPLRSRRAPGAALRGRAAAARPGGGEPGALPRAEGVRGPADEEQVLVQEPQTRRGGRQDPSAVLQARGRLPPHGFAGGLAGPRRRAPERHRGPGEQKPHQGAPAAATGTIPRLQLQAPGRRAGVPRPDVRSRASAHPAQARAAEEDDDGGDERRRRRPREVVVRRHGGRRPNRLPVRRLRLLLQLRLPRRRVEVPIRCRK
ncbi:exocyst complex component 3-like protein 4 isoform X1 [Phycodurus eques]|uniref:exocyst complex component 3-like protein 4 isoform X1 n=1 Tax=Phycodurus eques TaxID=693459 RepID=UPI002ACE9518|nr:exocyst complex component 3-like protein 4 isoform X1 [Phycodurus eques]XP_061551805.1 exocyst complex component 3-like protein 4 isoform X1 [Phycodurus eques]XP_061551806.1 exocyst complex component 3-like protein 4 isoform X1 [Phycodurus eques]